MNIKYSLIKHSRMDFKIKTYNAFILEGKGEGVKIGRTIIKNGGSGEEDDELFVAKFDIYLKILLSGTCIYG